MCLKLCIRGNTMVVAALDGRRHTMPERTIREQAAKVAGREPHFSEPHFRRLPSAPTLGTDAW